MRKVSTRLALAALVAFCLVGAIAPLASGHGQGHAFNLTFDKSAVAPGVWQGTVSGDISGHLETRPGVRSNEEARSERGLVPGTMVAEAEPRRVSVRE